jgi:hypothetical protein
MKPLLFKLLHVAAAIIAQLAVYFVFGNGWLGGVGALLWFAGREIAQAEYRWIEQFGKPFKATAEYAEWHYGAFGQREGRPRQETWDAYYAANPDLHAEYAKLAGTRSKMPMLSGLNPRVWNMHSILGLALPVVAVVALGPIL